MYTTKIESELNQIETEWKKKLKLNETQKPDGKNSIFRRNKVGETDSMIPTEILIKQSQNEEFTKQQAENNEKNSSNIDQEIHIEPNDNKKFIDSTQIHKKPKELIHIKNIFKLKKSNDQSNLLQIDDDSIMYLNNENSINQLFYIEYIIDRLRDLLSTRSKQYLLENSQKSKLQDEREREETLEKIDKFVSKKSAWFQNIEPSDEPTMSHHFISNNDDNGEAEMKAKIESLIGNFEEDEIKDKKDDEKIDNYDTELKKPLPDFKKIRDEAKLQQLKVKECFFKSPSLKSKDQLKETEKLNVEQLKDNDDDQYNDSFLVKVKDTNVEYVRLLPNVDSQSQLNIRRKFFYEKLTK